MYYSCCQNGTIIVTIQLTKKKEYLNQKIKCVENSGTLTHPKINWVENLNNGERPIEIN
jgi:hypothetical protein